MNEKLKKLFKIKADADAKLSDLFAKSSLSKETDEGMIEMTHPWQTTEGCGVQYGVYEINGEQATHLLNHFNEIENDDPSLARTNRVLNKTNVQRFAKKMEEGKWGLSDPICFEEGIGTLLNGQNRLTALAKVAQKHHTKDPSEFSIKFLIAYGCPRSMQDNLDKNSPRSLNSQAVINGCFPKGDWLGGSSLRILQKYMHKNAEGNGFNKGLADDIDVLGKFKEEEPNTGETYEEIGRWISEMTGKTNSDFVFQLGHQVALFQGYINNHKKIKLFVECITANSKGLQELQNKGVDISFSSDNHTSIAVARRYITRCMQMASKHGSGNGHKAVSHYGSMLYFMGQFLKGKKTTSMTKSFTLTCDIANKSKAGCYSFGYIQKQDPVKELLKVGSRASFAQQSEDGAKTNIQNQLEI